MKRWPTMAASMLLGVATVAPAQSIDASAARIERDTVALSADAMEGRFPGTRGEGRALAHIERALADSGARPAGRGGSWLQPVPLTARKPIGPAHMTVRAGTRTLDLRDAVILLGRSARERLRGAPLAYAGYAHATPHAPALAGTIALFRDGDMPGETAVLPTDPVSRTEALQAAGVAGALAILTDAAFDKRRARITPTLQLEDDQPFAIRGFIRESAARAALALVGQDLDRLDKAAGAPDFRPLRVGGSTTIDARTTVRRFVSHNLVARIPGSKAAAGTMLYTAHWDAFGRCRPAERKPICNGAIDNASGVAGLIELARLFRAGPAPERSILLVVTTAEEHGLLGSRFYVARPVVPLARTVASINLDTIALYPRGHAIGFVGGSLTDADTTIEHIAALSGRALDAGAGARFVAKVSDAWPLLRAGVPAFILSGAISRVGPDKGAAFLDFITQRVHSPGDAMRPDIPFDGAAEDVDLAYRIGLHFARADTHIEFLPGVPFRH